MPARLPSSRRAAPRPELLRCRSWKPPDRAPWLPRDQPIGGSLRSTRWTGSLPRPAQASRRAPSPACATAGGPWDCRHPVAPANRKRRMRVGQTREVFVGCCPRPQAAAPPSARSPQDRRRRASGGARLAGNQVVSRSPSSRSPTGSVCHRSPVPRPRTPSRLICRVDLLRARRKDKGYGGILLVTTGRVRGWVPRAIFVPRWSSSEPRWRRNRQPPPLRRYLSPPLRRYLFPSGRSAGAIAYEPLFLRGLCAAPPQKRGAEAHLAPSNRSKTPSPRRNPIGRGERFCCSILGFTRWLASGSGLHWGGQRTTNHGRNLEDHAAPAER